MLSFAFALTRYFVTAPVPAVITGSPVEPPEYRIDINTAGEARLSLLPGIGPVTARRIMEFREKNGPFESTRDLDKVYGIGPRTLENILPYVTVGNGE